MYAMRLRLHALLREYRPELSPTGYAIQKASGGAINSTLAARLLDKSEPPKQVHFSTLDALCDFLGCQPSELLARDDDPDIATPGKPAVPKRKRPPTR